MPLITGKKQVEIAKDTTQIPYIRTQSKLGIAFDAFKPTIERLDKEAAMTAQANYFQKFQIQTRDQLALYKKEFEMILMA